MGVDQRFIEPTFLDAEFNAEQLNDSLYRIKESGYSGITTPSFWVKKAVRDLKNDDIMVSTVVGYPHGFSQSIAKVTEAKEAISQGALGIHLVWSQTSYLSGMTWPKIEVAKLSKLCHEAGCFLSVMVSSNWVQDESTLLEVAKMIQDAGADFFTLGLDFSEQIEVGQIKLLRENLSSQVGIRTFDSGRDPERLNLLLNAGSDKIHLPGRLV